MSEAPSKLPLDQRFGIPPAPPGDLTPDTYAARLYASLAPLAEYDPSTSWSLLILCNAIGIPFQLVEEWVRDTPEGPGWSLLLDLDRCPDEALPWLAQFVGVRLLPDSTPDDQRHRIASTDGFRRGTPAAMRGAAQATLTGGRSVVFRERYGDPYVLDVLTYTSQTPDPAATERALISQKPGGIVLTYRTADGQDWQSVKDRFATWADVKATYATWADVRDDTP